MDDVVDIMQEELDAFGYGAVAENDYRKIIHDEKTISILHKRSGRVEKTSYEPELYNLLCTPTICSFSYNYSQDRMRIEVLCKQNSGKRWIRNVSRFIDLWHHKECSEEEFLHNLPVSRGEKSTDHANEDKSNSCFWNLKEVSREDNSKKGTRVHRIKLPYFFFPIVDHEGKYRVHFGYMNPWHQGQSFYILCEDSNALNSLCEAIMDIDDHPAFLRRGQTPVELWREDKAALHAACNFDRAEKEAMLMLNMAPEEFDVWGPGCSFKVPKPWEYMRKDNKE